MHHKHVGLIGCGRMGTAIARRLAEKGGFRLVLMDKDNEAVRRLTDSIGTAQAVLYLSGLSRLVKGLPDRPRVILLALPAGPAIRETICGIKDCGREGLSCNQICARSRDLPQCLRNLLEAGDIVLNLANADFRCTALEAEALAKKGIHQLDVGISGGPYRGAKDGFAMFVGGNGDIFEYCRPVFEALAWEKGGGYGLVGPAGAGHYIKTVGHNGMLEYAMMAVIGEFVAFLTSPKLPYQYNPAQILRLIANGSICRGFLVELAAELYEHPDVLESVEAKVGSAGQWGARAIEEMARIGMPFPFTALALSGRFASQQDKSVSAQVQAGLRKVFGGHGTDFATIDKM